MYRLYRKMTINDLLCNTFSNHFYYSSQTTACIQMENYLSFNKNDDGMSIIGNNHSFSSGTQLWKREAKKKKKKSWLD